jgi:hypothetical protein
MILLSSSIHSYSYPSLFSTNLPEVNLYSLSLSVCHLSMFYLHFMMIELVIGQIVDLIMPD